MAPLFNRKEKTTIAELEEYYANKKKSRPIMSWFMAFTSLLITVLVLVGIFFMSRWVYRSVTGSEPEKVVVEPNEDKGVVTYDVDGDRKVGVTFVEGESSDSSELVYGDLRVTESSESVSVSAEVVGVVDDEAATSSRSESFYADSGEGEVAGAYEAPAELPDTGAGEDIFALLATVVAAGYLVSRKRQLAKEEA